MTPKEIKALLREHGIKPSKALGQNFLADTNMAAHIVRLAGVQPGDHVVEVGPGLGSLTLALCDGGAHVRAVELDKRLAGALAEVVRGKDVDIVTADALEVDWTELLADHDHWIMVSNLPYNVATPVVVRALETAPMIDDFLVMVQREVGERLAAGPGSKAYGALSVKIAYYAQAEVAGSVPPAVFVPQPNVDSALVRLHRHETPPVRVDDPEPMFGLVRAGFATRRKMLRRALDGTLGDRAERVFGAAGVDPKARAETLTLTEWAALAHAASSGVRTEAKLDAYAKVTLSLEITGTRADGMHELDALVVSVSAPRDELVIRPAAETTITVTGPFAAGVPTDETNLAVRAANAIDAKVALELLKAIPHGAGLGGGSADAAAVLLGAPAVAGIDPQLVDVERIAASLGADVPFCLTGGAMRMQGIGEDLEPVNLPDLAIVIATPPYGCATADVYRAWDDLGGPTGTTVAIEGMPPLRNDLEPAAHHVEPRLAAFKAALERATGAPALLAGSGSSYALVFHDIAAAEDARARIAEQLEAQVVVGLTVDTGVRQRT